jgi:hypothetical protein
VFEFSVFAHEWDSIESSACISSSVLLAEVLSILTIRHFFGFFFLAPIKNDAELEDRHLEEFFLRINEKYFVAEMLFSVLESSKSLSYNVPLLLTSITKAMSANVSMISTTVITTITILRVEKLLNKEDSACW